MLAFARDPSFRSASLRMTQAGFTNVNWQAGLIKLTKKTLVSYLIISTAIVGSGLIYLFNPWTTRSAEAAWFNDNWGYRKAVTLTVTSSASDITNLQTLLTVDTTGITASLQTNCEDLRFTSTSGKILPYYAPSCSDNSATNKVWVLADLVPKNTTTYTLYMYYGNPSASSGSDSSTTNNFNLFNGLVGYWGMNESSAGTAADSSVKGNTTTDSNITISSSGKFANARSFNGTSSYSSRTSSLSGIPNINAAQTFSAWVNTSSIAATEDILTTQNSGSSVGNQFRIATTGKFGMTQWGGATTINSSATLSTSTWYHVVWTYDGTTNKLYLNGSLDNSNTTAVQSGSVANIVIGAYDSGSSKENFNGLIDDLRIYDRVLSASEVTQLYNDTTSSILTTVQPTVVSSTSFATEEKAPSPVAYWKFDDASGTSAQDSTVNNADGTLAGTTVPTWQSEDQCIAGKCLYFDGSTSKVTVAATVIAVKSVSMWVKPNTLTSTLIDLDGGTHKITVNSSGVITATGFTSPTSYVNGITSASLVVNTWNYVTVTTGTSFNTTSSLTMATDGTTLLKGFIDEVKLYNKALTQAEVNANYVARSNPEGTAAVLGTQGNNNPNALNNGMVGYWKMDQSSWDGTSGEVIDSSGNGNNGTAVGSATTAAGKFANGGSFNGSDSNYVNGGSSVNIANSSFTTAYWAKRAATGVYQVILGQGSQTTGNGLHIGFNTSNQAVCNFYGDDVATTSTVADTNWHHIVCTFDSNTKSRIIYIDGSQSTTNTAAGNYGGSGTLYIGRNFYTTNPFNGTLDEVRVYNRALTLSEVVKLYEWAPGPVGYWKMDDASGTSAQDSSGNANTGTWAGTTGSQWKAGKYGSGGNFNGSDNNISLGDLTITDNLGAATWETWIKADTLSGNQDFLTKWNTSQNHLLVRVDSNGALTAFIPNALTDTGDNRGATGNSVITAGTFYHVSVVFDGSLAAASRLKIFVNGVQQSLTITGTIPASLTNSSTSTYLIGSKQDSPLDYFDGVMDDVRVYNYARTADQIVSDMNAGHPNVGSPVGSAIAHYKFDEGYGTTSNNSGSQGSTLNGTLTNIASPATSTSGWTQSGKYGKGLIFDGSDDYVSAGNNSALNFTSSDFTLSVWVYPTDISNSDLIVSRGAFELDGYYLQFKTDGTGTREIQFISNQSGAYQAIRGNTTISLNAWTHIVFTRNGTVGKIYYNGIEESSYETQNSITNPATSTRNLIIGAYHDGTLLPAATFDEVKIYNYALTADQVKLDMASYAVSYGSLGDNSTYQVQAANQLYCIPGDSTSCAAPVGEWSFDEGTGSTVNDRSGNGNTGTWNGTLGSQWKPGKYVNGGNFNGSDNYVDSANATAIPSTANPITVEAWANINSFANQSKIVSMWDGSGNKFNWLLAANTDSTFGFYANTTVGGGTYYFAASAAVSTNQWYHLVGVYSGGSDVKLYVNGVSYTGTSQFGTNNTSPTVVTIGAGQNGASRQQFTNGKIDQVRIFNYARSAAQVAWDYNKGAPVGHWKLDECQGVTVKDSSGNSNTGTITSTQGLGTCTGSAGTMWKDGATGKYNSSLDFDGTGDYVGVSDSSSLRMLTGLTISAWVKKTSTGAYRGIFEKANSAGNYYSYGFTFTNGDNLRLAVNPVDNTGASAWYYTTDTSFTDTTNWHHVTAVFDGSQSIIRLYYDGILQTSTATGTPTSSIVATTGSASIGRSVYGNNNFFIGQIDDVKIFNYALTAGQIKQLFNENFSVRYGPSSGTP